MLIGPRYSQMPLPGLDLSHALRLRLYTGGRGGGGGAVGTEPPRLSFSPASCPVSQWFLLPCAFLVQNITQCSNFSHFPQPWKSATRHIFSHLPYPYHPFSLGSCPPDSFHCTDRWINNSIIVSTNHQYNTGICQLGHIGFIGRNQEHP